MRTFVVISSSPLATERLARRLSRLLREGDILCLVGELGSGKTTFVRGLAQGLRVTQPVQSPTFQLMRVYQGKLPQGQVPVALVHLDWFRLSPQECETLMAEDAIPLPAIYVIEWADRARERWPVECLEISFEWMSNEGRRIAFRVGGKRWERRLNETRRL
ncbi:MAG: tRNA (adenosine(37)-N6)-threonylcarbamoyltransferase complex ATPase subunit type 1 TsaE [Elusimicrobia bacterium]|nr:tRNA (adenosine(37)-N6)-threonylcarbamoyltransferase complex ATPase subunit type 1 TsaE [Elusimicrobiota bacterium]